MALIIKLLSGSFLPRGLWVSPLLGWLWWEQRVLLHHCYPHGCFVFQPLWSQAWGHRDEQYMVCAFRKLQVWWER